MDADGCRFVEDADLWVLSDADDVSDAGDGVSLHRLLDRAKPSLGEAASLAALVLEAVADLHEAGCTTHGGLDTRSVRISPEGAVRLADGEPGSPPTQLDDDTRRADVRAAAGIVAEIAASAGRPIRPLTEREEKLEARLASAADPRSLVRRGPRPAAHGLEAAVGRPDRRQAARQGLVALARAVADTHHPAVVDGTPTGDGLLSGAGPTGNGSPARRLPPPARRPPIWPRIWKGAAIGAAVAMLFGAEFRFFGDRMQRNVHVLLSGDAKAVAAGPRRPAPLPVLGPPAAGPVTHLELRPLDGCRPETVCNAVVQVTVTPQERPLEVAWAFELVDRCGSGREPRPGG
ncbi:MAG TPA: hypothetical protein VEN99_06835, partial [Acidimicrobiia bacterium]|nr:hypothetical protein [Acidimicrobiia bacterium]